MERLRKLFGWLNWAAEELSGGPRERIIREALAGSAKTEPALDEYQLNCPEYRATPLDLDLALARLVR